VLRGSVEKECEVRRSSFCLVDWKLTLERSVVGSSHSIGGELVVSSWVVTLRILLMGVVFSRMLLENGSLEKCWKGKHSEG